jgi:ribosomal protection tetracycline resistance protein
VSSQELNLGILAHVDAGKTTLTERLLYEAGAIDAVGSVDAGTTQTDSLALERRRGITIRSAVASFAIGDLHVNLIDTPGHPDFIAEVERVLGVLDGAILVVSAVEGVQPQTRILMRALERLRLPTLLFVNKIDRVGADDERVVEAIAQQLTPGVVALTRTRDLGTREASVASRGPDDADLRTRLVELLADNDERLLAAYVEEDGELPFARLCAALAEQTRRALVRPVFAGSAATGVGVPELMAGVRELLPAASGEPGAPVSAAVFKVERGPGGEKIACVRVFDGTIRTRDRLTVGDGAEDKVTALAVFERGLAVTRPAVAAGGVARLWGLRHAQVGDRIGGRDSPLTGRQFPPPTLESVVAPIAPGDGARLRAALAELAEQDPLIDVHQDDDRGELSVSLYGEVQKEVVQTTLADDYGIEVAFRETTPIYVERPARPGEAVELLHAETNPYLATIGLRVEPAPPGSGVELRLPVDHSAIPLYLYKTAEGFAERMNEYVRDALRTGLFGWRVTDCLVTMTRCVYSVPDGPPSRRGPLSTAADFRKLTPIVLRQALAAAGTVVCEPTLRLALELPTESLGGVLAALARLGAPVEPPVPGQRLTTLETVLGTGQAGELERSLPGLTGGEGVLESSFEGYRPVTGDPPVRRGR